jgi:hypothetical protein
MVFVNIDATASAEMRSIAQRVESPHGNHLFFVKPSLIGLPE